VAPVPGTRSIRVEGILVTPSSKRACVRRPYSRPRGDCPRPSAIGRRGVGAPLALIVAVALALAGAGCGTATTGPAAAGSAAPVSAGATASLTDVTLMMDWVPWVLDIPVDVAQLKGYYTNAGLRVKQTIPAGPTDVVKFVSTGKADFGLYYAPDTLAAISEGAPLVSVGSLMSHAPVGLAMAPGERAGEPKDLVGKAVGVVMIPSTRASFSSLLQAGGVPGGSVRVVDPGFAIVAPLLAHKYDAVAVTQFGELVQAEAAGQKLDYLDFREWGTPDYDFLNIVTSDDAIAHDPEAVRAFVAATMRGLQYAAAHPEEAVSIYVARHPELKKDLLLAQWRSALPSMAVAGAEPAGWQDPESWQRLASWMKQTGQLMKPVDVAAAAGNEYVPAQ
jgi:putative hydroxymethylpyrimidine transport system substrate-binding protein